MKRIFSILFALGLVLGFSLVATMPVAAATTYYVATTGSDVTGVGSAGNPWQTIQHAIDQVSSGDTIMVAAGTYNENVVINKHLTLSGAGVTTVIQPPLKPSGTGYGIEIMKEGSGLSATDHTIIKDLRVTGAYNGVTFHWYEDAPNYPQFKDFITYITLQNLQCDHNISEGYPTVPGAYYGNEGTGVRFEKYANYKDIHIDNLVATDNAGFGINSGSGVSSINELTVTGGYFARNVMPGFEIYYGGDIKINGAVFESNGIGYDVEGDIVLTNLNSRGNGNLEITDTTITSNGASTGIRISGGGTLTPTGIITLSGLTIKGTQVTCPGGNPWGSYPSAAIVLSRYSDVSKVSFNNVQLQSTAPVGLFLGTIYNTPTAPTLDLTGISFNGTYGQLITLGRHGNNPAYQKANVNVDARNAYLGGLTDNSAIEGKITHKLDDAELGLVTWICRILTSTGTGTASFTPDAGDITALAAVVPTPPGAPVALPHGIFSFTVTGLTPGGNVTITVELPGAVPVGTKWWKFQNNSWYSLNIGDDDGDNIITITLHDGALHEDADGNATNGQITDPGGPGGGPVGWEAHPINKVRVLLPWIALLAAIMAGASLLVVRRRRAQS